METIKQFICELQVKYCVKLEESQCPEYQNNRKDELSRLISWHSMPQLDET